MSEKTVAGIDLGTTYSCIGHYRGKSNSVLICRSETGSNTVPSYITFTDEEILVGDGAKNDISALAENKIYGM